MQKLIVAMACLLISFPAVAQTIEQDGPEDEYSTATQRAQGIFLQYHSAIRAEARCHDHSFTPSDQIALDKVTAEKMVEVSPNVALGAARLLTLVDMADDNTDHLISREGCDGQKVKESLQLYNDRLASVHGEEPAAPVEKTAGVSDDSGTTTTTSTIVTSAPAAAPMEVVPEPLAPAPNQPQPLTATP